MNASTPLGATLTDSFPISSCIALPRPEGHHRRRWKRVDDVAVRPNCRKKSAQDKSLQSLPRHVRGCQVAHEKEQKGVGQRGMVRSQAFENTTHPLSLTYPAGYGLIRDMFGGPTIRSVQ